MTESRESPDPLCTTQRGVSGTARQASTPRCPGPARPHRVRHHGAVTAAGQDGPGQDGPGQDGPGQDGPGQDTGTPQENVLVVTLDDPGSPTDPVLVALTEPGDGFTLRSAAIVRRNPDGAVTIGEHVGDLDTEGTLAEPSPDERVLLRLARAIPAGSTAVIADVVESDPEALDHRLAQHAVTVTRHPLAAVEADLADAPPADAPPAGNR